MRKYWFRFSLLLFKRVGRCSTFFFVLHLRSLKSGPEPKVYRDEMYYPGKVMSRRKIIWSSKK